MDGPRLPAVMKLLPAVSSHAVDAALVGAWPALSPETAAASIDLLARRGHVGSLGILVSRYERLPEELRRLALERAADLRAGVRPALASNRLSDRKSAIAFVCDSGDARLAYLLVDVLRGPCIPTRECAAQALARMARRAVDPSEGPAGGSRVDAEHVGFLGEAMSEVIRTWEGQHSPDARIGALLLLDWTESALRRKLAQSRGRVLREIERLLAPASDAARASIALRLLGVEDCRAIAAAAIAGSKSGAFIQAVLRDSWLLTDPRIARGFRWVREADWIADPAALKARWPGVSGAAIARCVSCCGATVERRVELLRRCVDSDDDELRDEGLEALLADPSEAAYLALIVLSGRCDPRVSRRASREVRRRRCQRHPAPADAPSAFPGSGGPPLEHWSFDALYHEYETLAREHRDGVVGAIAALNPEESARLRARLASGDVGERLRALRVVRDGGLERECAEALLRLARDADATVRGVAVALLDRLPGPTTERVLRASLDDADGRVQAQAIESLDRLGAKDREAWITPKLGSRGARARAGAVRALLRAELADAGAALLRMLEDENTDHRVGALWVVERLACRALARRIEGMAADDPDLRVRRRARRIVEGWGEPFEGHPADRAVAARPTALSVVGRATEGRR